MIPRAPLDRLPLEGESLFARAQKADYVIDAAGCWIWQKSKLDGYGMCATGRAHRAYYERANGPIPVDHDIHHRCETPACVNPGHLEAAHARAHDIENFLLQKGRSLDDVRAVRADRRAGKGVRQIAQERGIPFATVQDWTSAKRWQEWIGDEPCELPVGQCLRPGCENPVVKQYTSKKYCSAKCRSSHGEKRRRDERRALALSRKDRPDA